MNNLEKYIDHTNLKADMTKSDLEQLINEAKKYNFCSICINPTWVKEASELLKDSETKVCTVIGFPLGANTTNIKVAEAKEAIENGASEIDMVINIGRFKDKEYDYILNEINAIKNAIGDNILKVIVETCLLTKEEKTKVCELVLSSNADFIKTSTGTSTGGATVEDIQLFAKICDGKKQIKAAGGVRSYEDAINMIEAGAHRIGTSGGVKIILGEINDQQY